MKLFAYLRPILTSVMGVLMFYTQPSTATLVSIDDAVFGTGAVTRDTAPNGLEWLDLGHALGRSFQDLLGSDGSNEFITGGDFSGRRKAVRCI